MQLLHDERMGAIDACSTHMMVSSVVLNTDDYAVPVHYLNGKIVCVCPIGD